MKKISGITVQPFASSIECKFLYFSELIFLPFFKSDLFSLNSKDTYTHSTGLAQRPLCFETSVGLPTIVHIRLKGKLFTLSNKAVQESNVKSHFALGSCLIYSQRQSSQGCYAQNAPLLVLQKKRCNFFHIRSKLKIAICVRVLFDLQFQSQSLVCGTLFAHSNKAVKYKRSLLLPHKSGTVLFI